MKNTKKRLASLTLAALTALSGCNFGPEKTISSSDPATVNASNVMADIKDIKAESKVIDDTFKKSVNDFSIDLLKSSNLDEIKSGKNTLISPTSVLYAMCMTGNGADGNTKKEFEAAILKGIDIETYNKYMLSYSSLLSGDDKEAGSLKVKLANSIWTKKGLSFESDFLETDKAYYDAAIFEENFDESTIDNINNWVSNSTDKMIPKIINNLPPRAAMVLVNAICFESEWQIPYEEYDVLKGSSFTNSEGKACDVTMLRSTESNFISDEKATGFIKAYKGNKYSFVAILPNEGISIYDYASSLTGDSFSKLINSVSYDYEVYAQLPKFTYDYDTSLVDPLKNMGVNDAFTDSANFSKMSKDTGLAISDVIHKTHIEVDEKGTKAAASTAVVMNETCAIMDEEKIKNVILDRPFMYAIIDNTTSLPLFIGVVNTIDAN